MSTLGRGLSFASSIGNTPLTTTSNKHNEESSSSFILQPAALIHHGHIQGLNPHLECLIGLPQKMYEDKPLSSLFPITLIPDIKDYYRQRINSSTQKPLLTFLPVLGKKKIPVYLQIVPIKVQSKTYDLFLLLPFE